MDRLLIALGLVAVAVVVALVLQRRRPAPPATSQCHVPAQLDRADFVRPEAPWLVAVFTSTTCDACAGVWERAAALDAGPSGPVAVQQVEALADKELHRRYGIEAVPLVVLADVEGIVRWHVTGPVTATDLWAAVAEAREPGSSPPGCQPHGDPGDPNPA